MGFAAALLHLVYGAALSVPLARATSRLLSCLPRAGSRRGEAGRLSEWIPRGAAAAVIVASLIVLIVTAGSVLHCLDSAAAMLALAIVAALAVEGATRAARVTASAPRGGGPEMEPTLASNQRPVAARFGVRAAAWLVALAWIPLLGDRLGLPPVAWDALTYHLQFPAEWLHTGRLVTSLAPIGDVSHTFFPLDGEMLLYWILRTTGTDLWCSIAQVPFALVAAGALGALAIECGAAAGPAALAALCWLGTPAVLRQSVEVMVDIEVVAYFLCALLFLRMWAREGRGAWLHLAAASVGLLVGTKYVGIAYGLALTPFGLWCARRAPRVGWRAAAAAVLIATALGGYAYARNLVSGGNPLLPLHLGLGRVTIFRGPVDAAYYFAGGSVRLGWRALLLSVRSVADMGPFFVPILLVLPAALATSLRRAGDRRGATASLAAAGIAAFLLCALALPFREHRYFFPVTAVGWALVAALAPRAASSTTVSRAAMLVLAIQAPITLFYWGKDLLVAGFGIAHAVSAILLAGAAWVALDPGGAVSRVLRGPAPSRGGLLVTVVALAILLVPLASATSAYERSKFDLWYRYWSTRHAWKELKSARPDFTDMAASWRVIAERTRSAPAVVAYAGLNAPYPLTGFRMRNQVVFVPRKGAPTASVWDWGRTPPGPMRGGTREAWMRNVEALGVRFLCLYRTAAPGAAPVGFPAERAWADSDSSRFALIWSSPHALIYRIPEGGQGPGARNGGS